MTQRTSTNKKNLEHTLNTVPLHEQLRLAKQVRKLARGLIADGQAQLAPAEMRELDAAIKDLESQLN